MRDGVTLLLVRHGSVPGGREILWGRTPEVRLSQQGRVEVHDLARTIDWSRVRAILSSPQQRTLDTACILARHFAQVRLGSAAQDTDPLTHWPPAEVPAVTIDPDLDEFAFGDWTGQRFSSLAHDPRWEDFNRRGATASAPNGESLLGFRARACRAAAAYLASPPGTTLLLVTHAEVIRTIVLEGLHLELQDWSRVVVEPASINVVEGGTWPPRVMARNIVSRGRSSGEGRMRRRPEARACASTAAGR